MDGPEIIFSEDPHQYVVGGIVRPSTTLILNDLGFTDFSFCTEDARNRGKDVHAAIESIEAGYEIDWSDPFNLPIHPYIDAYLLMKEQTGWKPRLSEQVVFCPLYNYCGTMDGFGDMPKLGLEDVLPDYKTGIKQKATRYQTASYAAAHGKPLAKRCSIQLKSTGKYEIIWYDKPENRKDVNGWRAIATTYHLKHGGM